LLKELFEYLTKKYNLNCQDVFKGNKCIYSSLVMNKKGKEKDETLNKTLIDLLDVEDD